MASSQHQQASAAFATLIATGRQDRNTGAIQAGLDIGTPLLRPAQQSVADRAARWAITNVVGPVGFEPTLSRT